MVVYSGSNAMNSHPRHAARYAIFCRGYFRQRGRFDRTVVTMDQNSPILQKFLISG